MFTAGFLKRNRVEQVLAGSLTTMRIGGPATLVVLESRDDLREVVNQPHRWLGKGANLLVGDQGIPGIVVRLGKVFAAIEIGEAQGDATPVTVGAGCDLAELMSLCIRSGLAGPEGLAGVPATVGGALRMNAGTSTCWMLDWVSRVEVLLPGEQEPRWIERAAMPASYRNCGLPLGTIFLSCQMRLSGGDSDTLRATAGRLKRAKAATQPLALASAGCVFKNPRADLPAGRLIDELGLKGARCGGASVSTQHANFIVNEQRNATAADVATLITRIRRQAWNERGVVLDMEVETWDCPAELHRHPRDLVEVGA
jgi:UDP-N-acetylmuramate dehydrogenase